MNVNRETCFVLPANHKPGEVARITSVLKEENVALKALWGHATGENEAKVCCVPTDIPSFKQCASKAGMTPKEGTCFYITGRDETGVLADLLNRIGKEGINLNTTDAIKVGDQFGCYLWCEEGDVDRLAQVLNA